MAGRTFVYITRHFFLLVLFCFVLVFFSVLSLLRVHSKIMCE